MFSLQFQFKNELLSCLLITVVIAVIYGQTINFSFINYDDYLYITENQHVQQGLTLDGVKWAFSFENKDRTYWHPLAWLSHMADITMFGNQPGFHHLMNVLWHVGNACLLFLLLQNLTRSFWPSILAASLFAVHPINVESVAWIAERKNLLSTFFWLLSTFSYVHYARNPGIMRYLLLLFIFIAGLLAKPMLVTLPFVFLLLDYWPLKRISFEMTSGGKKQSTKTIAVHQIAPRLLEKIPLICIALLATYLATQSLKEFNNIIPFSWTPLYLRIENLFVSYVSYVGKILWPTDLAFFYPFPTSLSLLQVSASALLLGAVTILTLGPLREKKYISIGWLWFLGTLIPVSGLFQAGLWPALADRWAYVPSIGLFIIVAWGLNDLLHFYKKYIDIGFFAITAVIILIMGTISWHQTRHWKNNTTLYSHALAVTSNNSVAHNNLGIDLVRNEKIEEAIRHFKEAIRIAPTFSDAHRNLANAYVKTGNPKKSINHFIKTHKIDFDDFSLSNYAYALRKIGRSADAIDYYRKILEQNPNDEETYCNLGITYHEMGRNSEAIAHFKKALRLKPDYVEAQNSLADIYVQLQQTEQAIDQYTKVLELNPEEEISILNLANIYANQNNHQRAVHFYSQYIRLKPEDSSIHFKLAQELTILGQLEDAIQQYLQVFPDTPNYFESLNNVGLLSARLNKHESAIEYFKKALAINPDNADIHYNLGYSYAAIGRTERAKKHYITSLEINPDLINAHNNLGVLYAQDNQTDLARDHFEKALQIDNFSVDGHINMGVLLYNLGKKQEAANHFQQAQYLSPNHPYLKQILH